MGRQKSGVSMLSLQRMLEIRSYKTVWTMGHKIRQAMAERDAHYKVEIQPLVRDRLAAEAVIKTDGWQGYSFLDTSPHHRHELLVPGSGKEAPKVLP